MPPISLTEVKSRLHAWADRLENTQTEVEADPEERLQLAEAWTAFRHAVATAPDIEALCGRLGYERLANDGVLASRGRADRREFAWSLAGVAVALSLLVLGLERAGRPGAATLIAAVVLGGGALLTGFLALARRLHDFGGSLVLLAAPAVLWRLAAAAVAAAGGGRKAGDIAAASVWLLFLLVVGLVPGTPAEHAYGPPPPRR